MVRISQSRIGAALNESVLTYQLASETPPSMTWHGSNLPTLCYLNGANLKTGNRIRRIKCDEGKPTCNKCRSTGRVCDGYAVVRLYNATVGTQKPSQRFSLPIHRFQPSDISGTENDRRFFHTFRVATEAGVSIHITNNASFWKTLVPRVAHYDDAVKHATIALGAAVQFFKIAKEGSRSVVTNRYRSAAYQAHVHRLELFAIQSYNIAIGKLQAQIASDKPETAIVVLTCCVVFVCIENLRFNHRAALLHLKKGAQILDRCFDIRKLLDPPSAQGKVVNRPPLNLIASHEELKSIANYFRCLEIAERLFASEVPLTVTNRLYNPSRLENNTGFPEQFTSLEQSYQIVTDLVNDVMGFEWETIKFRGQTAFWDSPHIAKRYAALVERGDNIHKLYKSFMDSKMAPRFGTREYASCCLNLVQIICMQGMINMLRVHPSQQSHTGVALADVVRYSERLLSSRRAFTNKLGSDIDFTVESGVVAPLYFGCVYTTNTALRTKALKLLSECDAREGPWDGKSLVKLMDTLGSVHNIMESPASDTSDLPRWGSDMDCYGLFSVLDITEW
jgi:hypothetical protein